MKQVYILLFLLFTGFSSFGQSTVEGSFMHDGALRTYDVYIPASYDDERPTPLVFNLHGYTSTKEQQAAYGDFRAIADTARFIIVHPQGRTDGFGITHWNCFGTSTVDDVDFLSQLIDTVYAQYNIDGNRIYSTGMSNGGFMSYKLACQLSGRIAAIASVTGSMTVDILDECNTNHPMPVMEIHGDSDGTVPYEGTDGFVPVADVVAHWAEFNECDDAIVTEVPDTDPTDGCTATHYFYDNGLIGSTVEHFKINGGEHTWPGSAIDIGVTNYDIDASVEIWRFFSQYRLNELTSSVVEEKEETDFTVYPNPSQMNDQVTISFPSIGERQIDVLDLSGKVIRQITTSDKTVSLSIETSGVYFIAVTMDHSYATQKLIISK